MGETGVKVTTHQHPQKKCKCQSDGAGCMFAQLHSYRKKSFGLDMEILSYELVVWSILNSF